jgi:hypothetical protein
VAPVQVARASRALALGALLALALGASGCATKVPTRYAWGGYEDVIYAAWAKPGTLPPDAQLDLLQKDREAARAANQKLPPGWHAHVGYLYHAMGRADLAREELLAEKTEFPESATFVDRLLSNMSRPAEKTP